MLTSVYSTEDINNTEKAYDDLVLNDKKIDDVFYKNANKDLSNENKNIFEEAKKLFNLRVKFYKKLILEGENLEFEESTTERTKVRKQKSDELPHTTDMPKLESGEYAAKRKNKQGKGLKILTPMLSRLPISLAQLKAGDNSEKFKNEIRQILYSLYR